MRRILIADSHPVARAGFRQLLETTFAPRELVEVASREALLAALAENAWDLVLLDHTLPGRPGIEMLQEIRAAFPAIPILVVSSYPEDVYAGEALRAGATGFLSKASSAEGLLQAVGQVLSGRRYVSPAFAEQVLSRYVNSPGPLHEQLSPRERAVFHDLAAGKSITSIASRLNLSVKTVSTYRARILEKMGMRTNAEITAYSMRLGLEAPTSPKHLSADPDDKGS